MKTPNDRRESGGFFLSNTDSLGESVILTVDLAVFDKASVFKAAYWSTGKAFLYFMPLEPSNPNILQIEVRPKTTNKESAEELARELANSLVDHQTRQIVLRETYGTRDALLRKAFGEGRKHLDPETLS